MFGPVLIVAYTVLLAYVLVRAASVPVFARHLSRKGFVGVGALLWVSLFLALLGHLGSGPAASALESAGMVLLGSAFLVATVLFAVDLGTLFGRVLRRWTPALRGCGIVPERDAQRASALLPPVRSRAHGRGGVTYAILLARGASSPYSRCCWAR